MPTDRYLARVREILADSLSQNVLEEFKAHYVDPEIFPFPVNRRVYTIPLPVTRGLSFPIKFSFAVVDRADGKAYEVFWHPTHQREKPKLLGEFHDYRDPARRYISHESSLKADNCSGAIVLPPWHVIQGLIASLRSPSPDIPVQLAARDNVKKGDSNMGTAVIIVNSNDLSQRLDTITWTPRRGNHRVA